MQSFIHQAISRWGLLILVILIIAAFGIVIPDTFLTAFTFQSILNSNSIDVLAALAVMLPLCANQYDLSVASVLSMAQVLANGLQTQQHMPWLVAVGLILAMGAVVGMVNGFLVTRLRISSFIATLGSGTVLLGLNEWYTGGQQITGDLAKGFTDLTAKLPLTGLPLPFIYVLTIGTILWFVLGYTPIGRFLYICGDNPRAALLSGIRVARFVTGSFIASGMIAAFAGIVLGAQLRAGQSTVGQELLLPAFTGALLGATSIVPGRPNVWGTVLAVAVLSIAVAGLSQLGAPFFVAPLFNGSALVVAVGLANAAEKRREKLAHQQRSSARRTVGAPTNFQV